MSPIESEKDSYIIISKIFNSLLEDLNNLRVNHPYWEPGSPFFDNLNIIHENFTMYSTPFSESFSHQDILNNSLYLTNNEFTALISMGGMLAICFGIPVGAALATVLVNVVKTSYELS